MNVEMFTAFPTGNLCNANPAVSVVTPSLRPLIPGRRIAGRARTARTAPGQNAAIHRAVRDARPGDLLVVDGGGSERYGPFGDLLADACLQRGIVGGVFDCTTRDSADIAALGFQIFTRGFHPEATGKSDPGETDLPVTIGGVVVNPGDIVVGDDDGVVVIPADLADEVAAQAAEVVAREETIRQRIRGGETTFDIFQLTDPGKPGPPDDR